MRNKEYIKNICDLSASVFNYKVNCYDKALAEKEGFSVIIRNFKNEGKRINYYIYADSFAVGYIELEDGCLLIGPAIVDVCDIAVAKKFISASYKERGDDDLESNEKMQYIIDNARYVPVPRFINEVCLIASAVLDEVIFADDLLGEANLKQGEEKIITHAIEKERNNLYYGGEKSDKYNIENMIASYVRKGETTKLLDYLYTVQYLSVKMGPDALRSLKNSAIILNNVLNRAAIEGGVSKVVCHQLGAINLQQIESCKTIESLSVFGISMAKEYCERVRKAREKLTEFEDINTVIRYIDDHIHERIKVTELAQTVFLSPEYLSVKFHNAVGDTIPSYINRTKVEKAKELLTFSDMPLGEISEYLSFSSQSYFQNIFKKYSGVTPKEYQETVFSEKKVNENVELYTYYKKEDIKAQKSKKINNN